ASNTISIFVFLISSRQFKSPASMTFSSFLTRSVATMIVSSAFYTSMLGRMD
ncbi:hypothetical protein L9F63_007301, partial [Diploptera punctata]